MNFLLQQYMKNNNLRCKILYLTPMITLKNDYIKKCNEYNIKSYDYENDEDVKNINNSHTDSHFIYYSTI